MINDDELQPWRQIGRGQAGWREAVERALDQVADVQPLDVPRSGRVLLAGDWHGDGGWAQRMLERAGDDGLELVIQLGDFGIGMAGMGGSEGYLDAIDATAARAGVRLLFLDGNHENFPYLYRFPLHATGLRPVRRHIWHIPRGFRWTWGEKTWQAVGGATSTDRVHRREGADWWPEEALTDDDAESIAVAARDERVGVLLTHDAPRDAPLDSGRWPVDWAEVDRVLAEEHRDRLSRVCKALRPRKVVHGHWHYRYQETVETTWGSCEFIGLHCNGGEANVATLTI